MTALPVTVVIPTLNEVDRLPACLEAVQWAAQIVVADAGSTDGTIALARQFGATVVEGCGPTIAHQRNAAIALSEFDWVLAVDADERVSPELRDSIAAVIASPAADAYLVHMRNRYLGAPMERGGWGRDRHIRLFRSSMRYRPQKVHEGLDYDGPAQPLNGRLDHDSYRNLEHQLNKVTNYSSWGAADLYARGKRAGLSHLVGRPVWRFLKCYFLQGAWREGRRGLVLSVVHAWSAFAKYALLWDQERLANERMMASNAALPTSAMASSTAASTAVSSAPSPVPVTRSAHARSTAGASSTMEFATAHDDMTDELSDVLEPVASRS